MGSATRSPLIVNAIKDFIGKEPQRTMNSEEVPPPFPPLPFAVTPFPLVQAVSKGCALMGAMISPNFRVREFQVPQVKLGELR